VTEHSDFPVNFLHGPCFSQFMVIYVLCSSGGVNFRNLPQWRKIFASFQHVSLRITSKHLPLNLVSMSVLSWGFLCRKGLMMSTLDVIHPFEHVLGFLSSYAPNDTRTSHVTIHVMRSALDHPSAAQPHDVKANFRRSFEYLT
jgi:hypothetical protein